jgi:hypothetical protein
VSIDPFHPPLAAEPGLVVQVPVEGGRALSMADPYYGSTDLNELFSPDEREALQCHQLAPGVGRWAFATLTLLTFGLFGVIYHQAKQSKLPAVKLDDPTTARALGLLFIPLFNIYWSFVAWPRLVDRINFQYRLRGRPAPLNRGHVVPALALAWFGWFIPFAGIAGCLWLVMLGVGLQSAANRLATGRL